ncbi:MAG: hypothetical protein GX682_02680 [Clostridiaceae bacterium]|nr:hypothetical protein [Clostridiaceae bacterium]
MKNKKIKNIISIIFIIVLLIFSYQIYNKRNFNSYIKAEYNPGISKFERDSQVKYNNYNSYKIESIDYNDAMFFKKIEVKPNTSYKVKCKIKTENVETKNENIDAGAHICIGNSFEKSDNVVGTTDWKEVVFYFNSKNRKELNVGFRLGGAEGDAKGKAWFSDFSIESAAVNTSNNWNFLCLLFNNVDVNINGQNVKLQLTQIDKDDMTTCMRRFQTSMKEMTNGKMNIEYDIAEITTPISSFSYDEENGYYVSGYNIKDVLDTYVKQGKYDHVFVAFRTGDINRKGAIPVNDWIGLGSMEYRGLGFSNIRLPDDDNNYVYKYDNGINIFPEEVFIHEFLHTLERNSKEYGYERPELHSNSTYGYENKKMIGLKEWYQDYMNKNINSNNGKIGLPSEIYTKKPSKSTDFTYSHKLDYLKEPENIIEELNNVVIRIRMLFNNSKEILENQ